MRILPALPLLLAAAAASAQPPQGGPPGGLPPVGTRPQPPGLSTTTIKAEPVAVMLSGFDSNGDARITRAEAEAGVARSFASVDTDRKGSLGYIEFADWAERWLGDRNALPSPFETDSDGDNRITLAELQAKIASIFTRLDRDKNGVLTHAELLTLDFGRGSGPGGPADSDGRPRKRGR